MLARGASGKSYFDREALSFDAYYLLVEESTTKCYPTIATIATAFAT